MGTDTVQHNRNLRTDPVQIMAVRHPLFTFRKQVLIPTHSNHAIFHPLRIGFHKRSAHADQFIDGLHAGDFHLIQLQPKQHQMKMGIIEARDDGSAFAVNLLKIPAASFCRRQHFFAPSHCCNPVSLCQDSFRIDAFVHIYFPVPE